MSSSREARPSFSTSVSQSAARDLIRRGLVGRVVRPLPVHENRRLSPVKLRHPMVNGCMPGTHTDMARRRGVFARGIAREIFGRREHMAASEVVGSRRRKSPAPSDAEAISALLFGSITRIVRSSTSTNSCGCASDWVRRCFFPNANGPIFWISSELGYSRHRAGSPAAGPRAADPLQRPLRESNTSKSDSGSQASTRAWALRSALSPVRCLGDLGPPRREAGVGRCAT